MEVARQKWLHWVAELRVLGLAINHHTLVEVAALKNPPNSIVEVMCYIGLLLGLKPTWESVKRSLFQELFPLQRALREVGRIELILIHLFIIIDILMLILMYV